MVGINVCGGQGGGTLLPMHPGDLFVGRVFSAVGLKARCDKVWGVHWRLIDRLVLLLFLGVWWGVGAEACGEECGEGV